MHKQNGRHKKIENQPFLNIEWTSVDPCSNNQFWLACMTVGGSMIIKTMKNTVSTIRFYFQNGRQSKNVSFSLFWLTLYMSKIHKLIEKLIFVVKSNSSIYHGYIWWKLNELIDKKLTNGTIQHGRWIECLWTLALSNAMCNAVLHRILVILIFEGLRWLSYWFSKRTGAH